MSPIAREEHPCWVPTCDFCGEGDNEDGASFHYLSEREAIEAVEAVDWRKLDDGKWQCLACHENTVDQAAAEAVCAERGHLWNQLDVERVCARCSFAELRRKEPR